MQSLHPETARDHSHASSVPFWYGSLALNLVEKDLDNLLSLRNCMYTTLLNNIPLKGKFGNQMKTVQFSKIQQWLN